MDLQQMRYVLAVAETRNFTRAAKQCFVVQSALSHRIRQLEEELGVSLFARTSRRVELTEAGSAFLPGARAALEAADRAAADAAAASGVIRGTVTIGVIPTVTIDLPAMLAAFARIHPDVDIAQRLGSSRDLAARIHDGVIDLAILGLPEGEEPRGVASAVLVRERQVAVVPVDHALAGAESVRLSDLAPYPFADFAADSPGRAQSDLAFLEAGVRRRVAFEGSVPHHLLTLVAEGVAVALLPPAVVGRRPDVVEVPVIDGPTRVVHLAWSEFNPSPAARALVRAIQAYPDGPAPAADTSV